ncbi:unnamed protein product, partial [Protopolystoma xenopodis]
GNEDSDQLALLAKLALSKHDNRPLPSSLRFDTGSKFGAPNEDEVDSKNRNKKDDHSVQFNSQLSIVRCPSVIISSPRIISGPGTATTASSLLSSHNRTYLLSSNRSGQNVPLHVQRIGQPGASHILLRPQTAFISNVSGRRLTPFTSNINIRCICGFTHDDGCLVQCDTCKIWQHGECVTAYPSTPLPSIYFCELCNPRTLRVAEAISLQRRKLNVSGSNSSSFICPKGPSLPSFRQPNGQYRPGTNSSSSLPAASRILVASAGTPGSARSGSVQVRLTAQPLASASEGLLRQRKPTNNQTTEYAFFASQTAHGIQGHYYRLGLDRHSSLRHVASRAIGISGASLTAPQSRTSKRKQDLYNCVAARESF